MPPIGLERSVYPKNHHTFSGRYQCNLHKLRLSTETSLFIRAASVSDEVNQTRRGRANHQDPPPAPAGQTHPSGSESAADMGAWRDRLAQVLE